MFGIGFGEILLIFVIIIIFIRPDDLPKFLRSAGRFYGKAKKMYKEIIEVKDRIIKEIDEAALNETPKTTALPRDKAESPSAALTAKESENSVKEDPAEPQTKEQ